LIGHFICIICSSLNYCNVIELFYLFCNILSCSFLLWQLTKNFKVSLMFDCAIKLKKACFCPMFNLSIHFRSKMYIIELIQTVSIFAVIMSTVSLVYKAQLMCRTKIKRKLTYIIDSFTNNWKNVIFRVNSLCTK
jgi:hypothetical protein